VHALLSIILPASGPGIQIRIFGFASDIERADVRWAGSGR
jgi:hypothetical protein